jgi:hypothetical protein
MNDNDFLYVIGEPRAAVGQPMRDAGHRVPRMTKLMVLTIRFEGLVRDGVVAHYGAVIESPAKKIMNDEAYAESQRSSTICINNLPSQSLRSRWRF